MPHSRRFSYRLARTVGSLLLMVLALVPSLAALAQRRLGELAEHACDAWAARHRLPRGRAVPIAQLPGPQFTDDPG